ncbi:translocator protein, LysE family [Bacteriovorax sp. Seq25_V]|nr:translocator protein, LysE family [Bacteriovorax sp. Seq25_V]
MVAVVGLGLMQIFTVYPIIQKVLKIVCMIYLVYLSYKIAVSSPDLKADETSEEARPFTFLQAALFQWVNPKAIAMTLSAISIFAPSNSIQEVMSVAIIFGLVNLPSVSLWVVIGQQIRRFLNEPKRLRFFNYVMASLLFATLGFILG